MCSVLVLCSVPLFFALPMKRKAAKAQAKPQKKQKAEPTKGDASDDLQPKGGSDLSTPLRLPRDSIGCTVEVYWAGDGQWYRAEVLQRDFVNQAVLLRYEGEVYADGVDGEWEPATAASMRLVARPEASADPSPPVRAAPPSPAKRLPGAAIGRAGADKDKAKEKGPGKGKKASKEEEARRSSKKALNLARISSFCDDSCVGRCVAVFWPKHVMWYEGEVTAFNKKTRRHRILYTDGRQEWANLAERGRFLSDDPEGVSPDSLSKHRGYVAASERRLFFARRMRISSVRTLPKAARLGLHRLSSIRWPPLPSPRADRCQRWAMTARGTAGAARWTRAALRRRGAAARRGRGGGRAALWSLLHSSRPSGRHR